MPSLVSKIAAAGAGASSPPVPMAEAGIWRMPGILNGRGNPDESFLRAYGANGTVFANGRLLASATAGPEWKLFRQQPVDARVRYTTSDPGVDQRTEVVKHAALALLNRPNKFWSRFRLFEISQLYQDLTGKCHWVLTSQAGIPTGIWPVRPDRMTPVPDPDQYLRGWLYTAPGGMEQVPLEVEDVIYNPLPDPVDSYGGTGPIQSVLTEIDAITYAQQYNRNFFSNSARPDGVLSVDHRVSDEEWDEMTARWRESHRGVSRAHRVAVLEGVTWVPTSTSPKDMDFPELLSTGGDRVREAFAMHKIMTGLTEDVNRANAQTGEEIFAAWQVAPRLRRWKDVLNYQYLPRFGKTGDGVEWDFIYPMPVNREADNKELEVRSKAVALLVASGYDPADVLTVVGLPAMKTIPSPPPGGLPVGTSGMLPPGTQGAPEDAEAQNRRRERVWDALAIIMRDGSAAERETAAWNSLAGAR